MFRALGRAVTGALGVGKRRTGGAMTKLQATMNKPAAPATPAAPAATPAAPAPATPAGMTRPATPQPATPAAPAQPAAPKPAAPAPQPAAPVPSTPRVLPQTRTAAPTETPAARAIEPGGDNDYRNSTIDEGTYDESKLVKQSEAAMSRGLQNLEGPDRAQLAENAMRRLRESTQGDFERSIQQVGRRAAALGRIGSAQTGREIADVAEAREKEFARESARLADDAAGRTLDDRRSVLETMAGVNSAGRATTGDRFNAQQTLRGNRVGEREYQSRREQQAFERELERRRLNASLRGQEFNEELERRRLELSALNGMGA